MARGAHATGRKSIALIAGGVTVALVGVVVGVHALLALRHPDIVIGAPAGSTTATSGPSIILPPAPPAPATPGRTVDDGAFDAFVGSGGTFGQAGPEPAAARGLKQPDGQPWPPAVTFTTGQTVPDDLVFALVVGSDARKGEDVKHSRADSIHVVAINPSTRQGTMVGIPRDSWVEIPGKGRGKINDALARGGPDLLVKTVQKLTGLPIQYYVLTGFAGFQALVNDVGGVDVYVERRMNDSGSAARFERGWQHFNGGQALAFSRDRHDVAFGDFSRSEHQGTVLLSGLAKLRHAVSDDDGLFSWINLMLRRVELDVPLSKLPQLAALARQLDPSRITNVVAPGKVGTAGSASVVYLTRDAATLFNDLRDDAVTGSPSAAPLDTSTTAATTTTTAPPSTTTTSTARVTVPSTTTTTGFVGIITTTTSSSPSTTTTTAPKSSTTSATIP